MDAATCYLQAGGSREAFPSAVRTFEERGLTAGRRSFERRHDQHLSACDHDRRGVKRHARRRPRPPAGPAAACGVHGVTFTASPKRLVLVLAQDSTRNLDPDLRDFFAKLEAQTQRRYSFGCSTWASQAFRRTLKPSLGIDSLDRC
jgi:hypothetical protein